MTFVISTVGNLAFEWDLRGIIGVHVTISSVGIKPVAFRANLTVGNLLGIFFAVVAPYWAIFIGTFTVGVQREIRLAESACGWTVSFNAILQNGRRVAGVGRCV